MEHFFTLLHIALGHKTQFTTPLTDEEWKAVYDIAVKQTMAGIAFCGVQSLPPSQQPPKPMLVKWYMAVEKLKKRNAKMSRITGRVSKRFSQNGFPNLILKGQGITQLYPAPLNVYRHPGDIDIWLLRDRKSIIKYVRSIFPNSQFEYHHVDFPAITDIHIEVHVTPSWMNNYFTNRRLQQFFKEMVAAPPSSSSSPNHSEVGASQASPHPAQKQPKVVPTPSLAFNRIYILVHIYRHLFHEGIGLRQVLDYYFVLKQGFTEEERLHTLKMLRSLKMIRFTRAMMYVLQEVFALPEQYLLITPDEHEGRFLLEEIMQAGNFGHYDHRIKREAHTTEWKLFTRRISRNLRFLRSYPSEVLWSPLFKIWHFFFRKLK